MKATRFSMTLYISLPVLASACSIVMIAHFVLLAEERIVADGLYGDLYTYIALAERFDFFNEDIHSFRMLMPLISGSIAALFSLTGTESLGLLTGSLNFLYMLIGFGVMYYLSMKERSINALQVALPPFLVLALPGFWQGVFLPVPDALMFCMSGLILAGILLRSHAILIPAAIAGVWVSEWLFLTFFLMPLIDVLRGRRWSGGYAAFASAALIYLAAPVVAGIPDGHLIYQFSDWLNNTREQWADREFSTARVFWRSFTFALPFFAYRIYVSGRNRVTLTLTAWFVIMFGLSLLMAGDTANRVMFLLMPALVLWQYESDTFCTMERPIERERDEAPSSEIQTEETVA
ncbi:hypothetical protein QA596_01700 [Balneolales bacterium ANBcel1]|nr:hypothetical protein [Balneolales bacterium ANBcel1]